MSYEDFYLAAQLLVEERIGTRIRESKAAEDASFKAGKDQLPRG